MIPSHPRFFQRYRWLRRGLLIPVDLRQGSESPTSPAVTPPMAVGGRTCLAQLLCRRASMLSTKFLPQQLSVAQNCELQVHVPAMAVKTQAQLPDSAVVKAVGLLGLYTGYWNERRRKSKRRAQRLRPRQLSAPICTSGRAFLMRILSRAGNEACRVAGGTLVRAMLCQVELEALIHFRASGHRFGMRAGRTWQGF